MDTVVLRLKGFRLALAVVGEVFGIWPTFDERLIVRTNSSVHLHSQKKSRRPGFRGRVNRAYSSYFVERQGLYVQPSALVQFPHFAL